ncbi:MAG: mechanosensitive ion channel family protein [Lachnospiraceae bacterium]|nr:mechanosensitive ion channel family protein [Lachnospiraceae bacterium]
MILLTDMVNIQEVEKGLNAMERFMKTLPEKMIGVGIKVIFALLIFIIGAKVISVIRKLVKKGLKKSPVSEAVEQFLDSVVKTVCYVLLIFMILQVFGLQATTIATVLGSAGVTIGLAIQGSLSNCIGGFLILILKPFKVGDYIIEDGFKNEGTVKEISIFYTKLSTPDNKIILIPNGTLANSSLTNVTDAPERRVDFKVGISYNANIAYARKIVQELGAKNELVNQEKGVAVVVDELGDSSVVLSVRFWAKKENYWDARFQMIEGVKTAFDEHGVQIPYNQLDVHLIKD